MLTHVETQKLELDDLLDEWAENHVDYTDFEEKLEKHKDLLTAYEVEREEHVEKLKAMHPTESLEEIHSEIEDIRF